MPGRRLTKRQRRRIQNAHEKRRERLEHKADQALQESSADNPLPGRVITRFGKHLAVEDDRDQVHHCLFRQNLGHVVCGDRVVWQPTTRGIGVVTAVMPRRTALQRPDFGGRLRPIAANLTQMVVVLAPEPAPSSYLIDQYLVAAQSIPVNCLLALNKVDLLKPSSARGIETQLTLYATIGYPVIRFSATGRHGLEPLADALRDHTSILVGQSGVGKSSVVKALLPERDIEIGRLSRATGHGRHTTSAATLYHLPHGGDLIDSPGVRSFRLTDSTRTELAKGFVEFRPYLGKCRFSDCRHETEPGCALRQAVEEGKIARARLDNFIHMARMATD
jgi:ribosome biogenesis GTPase